MKKYLVVLTLFMTLLVGLWGVLQSPVIKTMVAEVIYHYRSEKQALAWYKKAAAEGCPRAMYALGHHFYRYKAYRYARKYLELAADKGMVPAQRLLGMIYAKGLGRSTHHRLAMHWFGKAAQQGDVVSQYHMGSYMHSARNYPEAFRWWYKAALCGHALAQFGLAGLYETGRGIDKNEDKAILYYAKAGRAGHGGSLLRLAHVCEQKKMERQAFLLYQRAAHLSEKQAILPLARAFEKGKGCPLDLSRARSLYQEAAHHQEPAAEYKIGLLSCSGHKKDYPKAFWWFSRAAQRGHPAAMNSLGECFYYGLGTKKNFGAAYVWYERSARAGYARGLYNLGALYHAGQGVAKNYTKARVCYEKAATLGDVYACYSLGMMYFYGQGVQQDYRKAQYWLEKAEKCGDKDAHALLTKLRQQKVI